MFHSNESVLTTDPYTKSLQPFVFMHIPKTAGSVVRLTMRSLFDEDDIFPGCNFPDFKPEEITRSSAYERYNVFIGHLNWDAVKAISAVKNRNVRVVTSLRNTYDQYKSQLRFSNKIGVLPDRRSYLMQVACLLGAPCTAVQHIYDAYEQRLLPREVFFVARDSLLKRLEERASSKDIFFIHTEDLRGSLDRLSGAFGLMRLPMTQTFLNSSEGLDESVIEGDDESIEEWRPLLDTFEALRQKSLSEMNDSKVGPSAATLNRRYIDNLRAIMPIYDAARLSARNAWPGVGWSLREFNHHGQYWRCADLSGQATIFVRLKVAAGYTLCIEWHSVPSVEVAMAIHCAANGVSLEGGDAIFREGKLLRYFALPNTIFEDDEWVEFRFIFSPEYVAQICFSEISVYRE